MKLSNIGLLFVFCLTYGFALGQSTAFFQNNTSLDFAISIEQSGTETLASNEWSQLSFGVHSWESKATLLSFGPDTILTTFDTITFDIGLGTINDTIYLNLRFVDTGAAILYCSSSGSGIMDQWHSDFNFHESVFQLGQLGVELKYRKEFNQINSQTEILFALQDTIDYSVDSQDFNNPNAINVISYNVQLMPLVTGNFLERASLLPPNFSAYQDVVVFQEAFSDSARANYLHPEMLSAGFNYYTTILNDTALPSITTTTNGGVVIYSKWPIEEEEEVKYANCSNNSSWDCLASKGVKYANINKLGRNYHIFGTHMEAGGSAADVQFRMQQYGEMRSFIDSQNIPSNEAVIIAGDLNTSPKDGIEFEAIQDSLEPIMPHHTGYYESAFSYSDTAYIIDHVWASSNHLIPIAASNFVFTFRSIDSIMWNIFDYSDHRTVNGRFVFPEPISVQTLDTNICLGDTVVLSLGISDSLEYIWKLNGGEIYGGYFPEINIYGTGAEIAGEYVAQVTNTLELGGLSDPITHWFYPLGPVSYEQMNQYHIANIGFQNPCGVSLSESSKKDIQLYPSINEGCFYINLGENIDKTTLMIFSAVGEVVMHTTIDHDKWINIDGAPAGYYSVCLSTTDMVKVFKIIVY